MKIGMQATMEDGSIVERAVKTLEKKIQDRKEDMEKVGIMFRNSARKILANEVSKSDYPGRDVTGKLEKSIVYTVDDKEWVVTIGPDGSATNKKGQPYDYWVEHGHFMTGWGKSGGDYFLVEHTNRGNVARWWPGYHYMQRSYEENKGKVKDIFKASLQKL